VAFTFTPENPAMAKNVEVTYEKGLKSLFVRDLLTENPRATVKDVNDAWTAAGHDGTVGDTTIYKIKSEIGKSPAPAKTLPLASPGFKATRIELEPDTPRKTANADVRGLVVEELRQRIKTASTGELIDMLNAVGGPPNERAGDPAAHGSI